jgi:hypothetical protein
MMRYTLTALLLYAAVMVAVSYMAGQPITSVAGLLLGQ